MTPRRGRVVGWAWALMAGTAQAAGLQEEDDEIIRAFAKVLNTKVMVASRFSQDQERAASVLSVLTRKDIEAYGARDISEILRLVPGFEFGVDVVGIFAPSSRGIWVHEGKALFMINGIAYNDFGNGNLNVVGAIPAFMVERVEIIRGPGSAVYGKFAEVAVVNVITVSAGSQEGGRLHLGASTLGGGTRGYCGGLSASGTLGSSTQVALTAGFLNGQDSRRVYQDFFGGAVALDADNSRRRWQHVMAELQTWGTQIRLQHFSLHYGAQDGFTTLVPPINGLNTEEMNNYMNAVKIQRPFTLGDRLRLESTFEIAKGNTVSSTTYPGNVNQGAFANSGQDMTRLNLELALAYESPRDKASLGVGYSVDRARNVGLNNEPGLRNSSAEGDYVVQKQVQAHFIYGQVVHQEEHFGVTLGGRYERTDLGAAFAPRVGLTWVQGPTNLKLLYGKAYRIALPWQTYSRLFNYAGNVTPETGSTLELEYGVRIGRHARAKMSIFQVEINNPITYIGSTNSYQNFGNTLSRGFEGELRYDTPSLGGFWNISYAEPTGNTSQEFKNERGDRLLGMVPLKMNLAVYHSRGRVQLSPSLTYLSGRDGQSEVSARTPGLLATTRHPALWLFNLSLRVKQLRPDMNLAITGRNLGKADYRLVQPYYGGHAPIPTYDRRVDLEVSWHF